MRAEGSTGAVNGQLSLTVSAGLVRGARATYGPRWERLFSYEEVRGCRRQVVDKRRSVQELQWQPPTAVADRTIAADIPRV